MTKNERISLTFSSITILLAIGGLLAYIPGLELLGRIGEDYIPMAPSTAIGFIIIVSVFLHTSSISRNSGSAQYFFKLIITAVVFLFGILEVIGYFSGRELNFEDAIFPPLGRMSPMTGALFSITGIIVSYLLMRKNLRRTNRAAEIIASSMALLLLCTGFLFVLAYLYRKPLLYGLATTIPMSMTASLGFTFLSVSLLIALRDGTFDLFPTEKRTHIKLLRFFLPLTTFSVIAGGLVNSFFVQSLGINPAIVSAAATGAIIAITGFASYYMAKRKGFEIDWSKEKVQEAREALIKSEGSYRAIAEDMPVFINRTDPDFRITFANESYCQYMGLEPEKVMGLNFLDFLPEDAKVAVQNKMESLTFDSPVMTLEHRFKHHSGELHWHRWTNRALFDDDGNLLAYQSVGEDITQWKYGERINSAQLRLLEFAKECTVIDLLQRFLDEVEDITDSKIGFYHFVEEDQETLSLQTWSTNTLSKMCTADGSQSHYPISQAGVWVDCIYTRKPVIHNDYEGLANKKGMPEGHAPVKRFVVVPVLRQGNLVAILGVGNKEQNYTKTDAETIEKFAYMAWDIILQKKTEEEIRHSREDLSITLNSIGDAVIATDMNSNIMRMNPVAEKMTGWSFKNAQYKPLKEVFHIENSQTGEIVDNPVDRVITSRRIVGFEKDVLLRGKDGSEYMIADSGAPIMNSKGDVSGVVLVFRDITEEIIMQEKLNHHNKMDAIGQLTGGIAHDFNNMLGGIMNASQLLKMPKHNLSQKALDYVDMILKASTRAADLTGKLLAFGRKGKIASTAIDLHQVIDETAALLKSTIDKKIDLSVEKNAGLHWVTGDGSALQNAFLNLGINASQAIVGSGEIIIETRNVPLNKSYCAASPFDLVPGDYCIVEVRDTGQGISPEDITKIFEPFFTTKKMHEGTGLGLAAVYGTVLNHHGAINVYSEVGSGTSFHVFFPCSEEKMKMETSETSFVLGSGLILLVDDEEIFRIIGKDLLEEMGYEVLIAQNGKEAIIEYEKRGNEIDLIIMDMIMPVMNGSEAFHRLREIDSACKVILTSGFTKNENMDELFESGLCGFIRKPYKAHELSLLLKDNL